MRAFTVRGCRSLIQGIFLSPQGLVLGEEGRSRVRTIIPMVPAPTEPSRFDRLAVGETPAGRVLLPAPEDDQDNRVLVAFVGDPGYERGAEYAIKFPEGVVIVASGRGAYGEAGRCGGWSEYLAILPATGGEITVRYKYGRYLLRWGGGRDVRLITPEEAAAEDAAALAAASSIKML